MTKEEYLATIEMNNQIYQSGRHAAYKNVVDVFLRGLRSSLEEGSSHVRFPPAARGGTVDNQVYPPRTEECLLRAKELYPWLDIEVHYKPFGDFGGTLRVLHD